MLRPPSLISQTLLGLLVLFTTACRDSEITTYRVPKDPVASAPPAMTAPSSGADVAPAGAAMAGTPVITAGGSGLTWTPDPTWQAKPAGAMRKGSYSVSSGEAVADLSITAFPGEVGGEPANVNRWRGQLGLPAVSDGETAASVTRLEVNGLKIAFVDLTATTGAPRTRLLGAIVPFEGNTWFFKMLGADAVVDAQKPAMLAFLRTIKAADAAPRP
jgi:hypothetical protein